MADNAIITLQNIDDEDFVFEYNSAEGNPPYLIAAGEVARYPEFLASHALKHLINKILNKSGERTNDQTRRLELANQIIVDTENIARVPKPTESQRLQKEVESLNQPSTLDVILNKRKAEKKHKKEAVKKEKKGKGLEEEFEGLKTTPTVKETAKEVKALPTRSEVIEFARTKMNMKIDEKTEKKMKAMKLADLMKEVQYD